MEIVVDGVAKHKIRLVTKDEKKRRRIQKNFNENLRIAGDVKFRFKSKVSCLEHHVHICYHRVLCICMCLVSMVNQFHDFMGVQGPSIFSRPPPHL